MCQLKWQVNGLKEQLYLKIDTIVSKLYSKCTFLYYTVLHIRNSNMQVNSNMQFQVFCSSNVLCLGVSVAQETGSI